MVARILSLQVGRTWGKARQPHWQQTAFRSATEFSISLVMSWASGSQPSLTAQLRFARGRIEDHLQASSKLLVGEGHRLGWSLRAAEFPSLSAQTSSLAQHRGRRLGSYVCNKLSLYGSYKLATPSLRGLMKKVRFHRTGQG